MQVLPEAISRCLSLHMIFGLNNNTTITTAAGYSFGNRSITALDWYNAADPRPDYYRYLPSYTSTWASSTDPVKDRCCTT